ncbi:MAG: N-acetylmuramoyl-L-alanine amidase [Pseudomonadota bacterium]|uniref:N-acetylmuramoyl-L-alanine amidase family protein n=1 Tax=Qipengyuania flava TaxID=192812 RepID=UPI0007C3CF46|nr:N-acetylmuramoyl-L-alanine amidase [Qipengyuania flava]KZX88533.1 N-acetylmuramoyl-L-alanine amidase [Erythrobacter sp. HI0020]KZY13777.1 N-acetylmuramoyl-L-alanine amidase [Erythrobacter sp. HI0037]KZY18026.1 N-acetylmuramoyl-L-alanine amidase [Erythrobacter sp. HI0038]MEC7624653.1 N-acetylmuramoyl-L-alanine amidase [Pseudomonadota bacterium]KZY16012.1 N-acetylmuramoyl-L-alanine amidase [Erythrobacter sp. HI0037]
MSIRTHILLLVLAPLVLVALLVVFAQRIPVPELGRGYVLRVELPEVDAPSALPEIAGREGLPLVVIDPGHGGHDPGASGQGYQEKAIVLALARALRDRLEDDGQVRVALTRDDDRYLVHAERVDIARRLDADLFLSIHADSAGDAAEVTGASIYTLSNQASSEAAARFAERENASDRLNGVDVGGQSDAVSTILVELSQRRTQDQSDAFARLIRREGDGAIRFHPQPRRSAALKVLRAPDVPSVLFESGFITNEDDAARLASAEGQARFAEVMARAIRVYFARQQES